MGALVTNQCRLDNQCINECAENVDTLQDGALSAVSCGRLRNLRWDDQTLQNFKLIQACTDGDTKKIMEALREGAQVETTQLITLRPQDKTSTTESALKEMDSQHEESVELDFAMPNAVRWQATQLHRNGLTPLMVACRDGHPDAVKVLLEAHAVVMATDPDKMRPLHFAAEAACIESVQLLLGAGADPTVEDVEGRTPFQCVPAGLIKAKNVRLRWEQLLAAKNEQSVKMTEGV